MELDQLWQTTLSEIELQISRPNFLTWFKNSRLIEKKKDGEMIIGLANNFSKEWVRNKYHKIIFEILKNYDDSIKKIDYTVIENKVVFFNNVVDGFEKIDVGQQQRDFAMIALTTGQTGLQQILKMSMIRKPR